MFQVFNVGLDADEPLDLRKLAAMPTSNGIAVPVVDVSINSDEPLDLRKLIAMPTSNEIAVPTSVSEVVIKEQDENEENVSALRKLKYLVSLLAKPNLL